MPVARAAPRIPISGKKPMPKIMSGSRMMLAMQPHSRLAMVVFIRPAAWKIFSKDRLSMIIREKEKAMLEYCRPRWIISESAVNIFKNVGIIRRAPTVMRMP